ncbi:MAG: PD-(D/E)XK nuclease family protein [Bacteroidales bacterium]|jgi:CRISPR/Cas system-associated exonuclease Cas4 (RecB family)|nr:PD-(D/E)XK nuclease family protein [Bacteroidales bacterium]
MMDFLERVAYELRTAYGDDMVSQRVVLPSRRAGLYLAKYLSRLSDRPQWSPVMLTVSELFQSLTELRPTDTETLIFELYRVYRKRFGEEMSFDDFWPWGEVIISDFNDIDLWLADADKLYSNISELKEIDAKFGGLTDEQNEIIRGFWKSFNPGSAGSEARSRFRSVWQRLGPLFNDFKAAMREKGVAGDGMLCRDVAERAMAGTLKVPEGVVWHVAGLNALNSCERELFRYLRERGQAKFYWDDGHFFMEDQGHKASVFMRENIRQFGNDLPPGEAQQAAQPHGTWNIIDTPSDTAQARMVSKILEKGEIAIEGDMTDTAVILADEKLLMPVLNSLPSSVGDVNVTMGHPFRFTSLYSFLKQLMSTVRSARNSGGDRSFRSEEVIALLRHQYFRLLAGRDAGEVISAIIAGNMIRVTGEMLRSHLPLGKLFDIPAGGSDLPGFLSVVMEKIEEATFAAEEDKELTLSTDREYLRLAMSSMIRIDNLIRTYSLDLKIDTCIRLIDRILRRLVVPFSGEPLRGIQVMGVLETRALEFRNIIFLSLNEGTFPGQSFDNTYIPYNIRRAFGLPTLNEHESIYSYYFFRLLRKPDRGWFIYNSATQGLSSGEMSRYLVRMSYSTAFHPAQQSTRISVGRSRMMPEMLSKSKEHNRLLLDLYSTDGKIGKYLSPSAINTWVSCRMKFYYRYVCGMPEEEILEKEIDQRRFGNILHETLNRLYAPFREDPAAQAAISSLAADRTLVRDTLIVSALDEMKWTMETLMAGRGLIIVEVLERYINNLLRYDAENEGLMLLNLEDDFTAVRTVANGTGLERKIRIGGRADRIDVTGGVVRVVDYKTGAPKKEAVTPEDLFDEDKEKRNDAFLQALIYSCLIRDLHPDRLVIPAIYWVQQLTSTDFTPYAPVAGLNGPGADRTAWEVFMERFSEQLDATLGRIFSEDEEYRMTQFERRCTWCPYRALCRR